jgi:hypothetical protein
MTFHQISPDEQARRMRIVLWLFGGASLFAAGAIVGGLFVHLTGH